jgi:hypothetical protein
MFFELREKNDKSRILREGFAHSGGSLRIDRLRPVFLAS